MKRHDYDEKNCEWNICHSQICNKVTEKASRTLVTFEIIRIDGNEMVGFANSTESPFSVEVATEFLVLL